MPANPVFVLAACAAMLGPEPTAVPGDTPPVGAAAPCIACAAPIVELRSLYSAEDWTALQEGEVLRLPVVLEEPAGEAGGKEGGEASGATRAESLIRRPPANVWSVLTDFEHWPKFMPLIDATHVGRKLGGKLWVEQRYSILLVPLAHTTIYDLAPRDGRLSWSLDEESPHDIAASRGAWALVPLADGRETLVRYDAQMSAGRAVPDFVERMLRERSLEQLLAGLRAEVLRRYPEP